MRNRRCTLAHRHHLSAVFASLAIMLLFGSGNPCAAQSQVDDFLPLSIGNQWTYKYLTSSADYLGDMSYSDSGVVAYTVVSKSETADSILWGFTEIRNIVEGSMHTYPPQYITKDTITDTTKFSLTEYKSGNHRLVRTGAWDWKSVFSFNEEFADSGAFFRYYPRVDTDTFTTTFAAPADNPFKYKFVTVFFRRYEGMVRSWYSDRVTGSYGRTNHTLASASITSVGYDGPVQPEEFSLRQNYPNPFNPSTCIEYSVPSREHVVIRIFNALGQVVATLVDETKAAGTYTAAWNASHMSSGVYFYQMRAGSFVQTKRMAVVK